MGGAIFLQGAGCTNSILVRRRLHLRVDWPNFVFSFFNRIIRRNFLCNAEFISHVLVSFLARAQTGMARALIYGTYTFCVFGIGCCFCNIFAAAEVSYSNQGARELHLVGGTELGATFSLTFLRSPLSPVFSAIVLVSSCSDSSAISVILLVSDHCASCLQRQRTFCATPLASRQVIERTKSWHERVLNSQHCFCFSGFSRHHQDHFFSPSIAHQTM